MPTRLIIEGTGAADAAETLAHVPGLRLKITEQTVRERTKDLVVLSITATIVGIASSAVTIADHIMRWRKAQRDNDAGSIERIVIVTGHERVSLDRVDVAELARLLAAGGADDGDRSA